MLCLLYDSNQKMLGFQQVQTNIRLRCYIHTTAASTQRNDTRYLGLGLSTQQQLQVFSFGKIKRNPTTTKTTLLKSCNSFSLIQQRNQLSNKYKFLVSAKQNFCCYSNKNYVAKLSYNCFRLIQQSSQLSNKCKFLVSAKQNFCCYSNKNYVTKLSYNCFSLIQQRSTVCETKNEMKINLQFLNG